MLTRPLAVVAFTDVELVRIIFAVVVLLVVLGIFSKPPSQRWYRS